jgi:hypothetical protein
METKTDGAPKGGKSSRRQPKDWASKHRDRWLNKLTHQVRIIYHQYPFPDSLPKENCPDWVCWVQQEYFNAMCPQLDLTETKALTASEIGGFLGYQCLYAVWLMDCVGAKFDAVFKDESANPDKYKNVILEKEECEKAANYLCRLCGWYEALQRLAGRALKSCVYQSYKDMSAFLLAFGKAFSRKPKTVSGFEDFGKTTFRIYHFMLWNWRAIAGLGSVRELHELLRKAIGEYKAGDLKRIEKICQRSGLHLRKPGRPKASK